MVGAKIVRLVHQPSSCLSDQCDIDIVLEEFKGSLIQGSYYIDIVFEEFKGPSIQGPHYIDIIFEEIKEDP